jgi:hypothetical protein
MLQVMVRAKVIKDPPKVVEIEHTTLGGSIEIDPFAAEYDSDSDTIAITIKSGHHLTIREPRGKDFLIAEGWIAQTDEDLQSVSFFILRLVLCCATFRKEGAIVPRPKMADFLDLLDDYESMEAAGRAMGHFQDTLSDYFERMERRVKDNLDLSK